jgi:hypothetical protein
MTEDEDLPSGFSDRDPDDPGDETVIGRVRGPWVVHAWRNYHYSAIQVDITGGREARTGVDVGDRSVTLAGNAWQPLVTEAVAEMQPRTGLSVKAGIIFGVLPRVDFEADGGVDESELEEITEELADILAELADAPLPQAS